MNGIISLKRVRVIARRNNEAIATTTRHCEEERRSNRTKQEWIASYLAMTNYQLPVIARRNDEAISQYRNGLLRTSQ
jgi:predicted RNA-binding protein (virulence factor B family)